MNRIGRDLNSRISGDYLNFEDAEFSGRKLKLDCIIYRGVTTK